MTSFQKRIFLFWFWNVILVISIPDLQNCAHFPISKKSSLVKTLKMMFSYFEGGYPPPDIAGTYLICKIVPTSRFRKNRLHRWFDFSKTPFREVGHFLDCWNRKVITVLYRKMGSWIYSYLKFTFLCPYLNLVTLFFKSRFSKTLEEKKEEEKEKEENSSRWD